MTDLIISDETAERLRKLAEREQRSVEDALRNLLDERDEELSSNEGEALQAMLDTFDKRAAETSPLEAFIGMFDDVDATDLSVKASGHMGKYFVKQHDDPA